MKYNKILLKLSGEALGGDQGKGILPEVLKAFTNEIKELNKLGVKVAVVVGGGNIHRGVAGSMTGLNRTVSDHMGMLATVINSLALRDSLINSGVNSKVLSAVRIDEMAEYYTQRDAIKYLDEGNVVIFAAGTGNPYFTTDTAAALRAIEIEADILLKATKVDGVYDRDPVKFSDAVKYDRLTYIDVLQKQIKVMDSTAISLCMDNNLEISVFNVFDSGNIKRVVEGELIGTVVSNN